MRNPFWHCHLLPTRHDHTCKQGNGTTEKLRQARIYQQSESLLARLNLLCLSYCLIHLKVRLVFSLMLEKISFQLLQRSRAAWFLRRRTLWILRTIFRATEASFSSFFCFIVYLLPANLLFLLLPLLNFFFGGILSRRFTRKIVNNGDSSDPRFTAFAASCIYNVMSPDSSPVP